MPCACFVLIRLGAELGFSIEQATFEALAENAHLLENISKERIRDELIKDSYVSSPHGSIVTHETGWALEVRLTGLRARNRSRSKPSTQLHGF